MNQSSNSEVAAGEKLCRTRDITRLRLGADADEARKLAVRLLLHAHVDQRILPKHAPVLRDALWNRVQEKQ